MRGRTIYTIQLLEDWRRWELQSLRSGEDGGNGDEGMEIKSWGSYHQLLYLHPAFPSGPLKTAACDRPCQVRGGIDRPKCLLNVEIHRVGLTLARGGGGGRRGGHYTCKLGR